MLEKLDTLIAFAVVMLGVSLIITILTQVVSTALGMRGGNLLWGVATLLQELAPGLQAAGLQPRDLAGEILQDHLISDSSFSNLSHMWLVGKLVGWLYSTKPGKWILDRWRYATAIRSGELVRMLERKRQQLLTPVPPAAAPTLAAAAQAQILDDLLHAPDDETARRLALVRTAALPQITPPAAPAAAVPAPLPAYTVQVDRIIQQVTDSIGQSVGKLETWFDSTMDRVSQRFVLQIRLWTIVFAFLLAFGFHLDSMHILDELSTNPGTRAALVNLRDGMLSDAKAIIPPPPASGTTPPALPVSPAVLQEALDQLAKANPSMPQNLKVPANANTADDVVTWLGTQNVAAAISVQYPTTVIAVLRAHAEQIDKNLAKAGIDLIPNPYTWKFATFRNFLGVLLSAMFLSLGAPFWYNALKNLSNLRTVVATKEDA